MSLEPTIDEEKAKAAAEALLDRIAGTAGKVGNAEAVEHLARAYALVIGGAKGVPPEPFIG